MGDKKGNQPQPNVGGLADTDENDQHETAQKGGQAAREGDTGEARKGSKTSNKNGDPGKGGAQGHGNRVGDQGGNRS